LNLNSNYTVSYSVIVNNSITGVVGYETVLANSSGVGCVASTSFGIKGVAISIMGFIALVLSYVFWDL